MNILSFFAVVFTVNFSWKDGNCGDRGFYEPGMGSG